MIATLFLFQLVSTIFMTGLIWFVQIVHYPLFALVEASHPRYAASHQMRTGWVVGGPMLAELATSLAFLLPQCRPPFVSRNEAWFGFALLAIIWAATAFLQIPAHNILARRYDKSVIQSLVRGNWVRTVAWTARTLLICLWLHRLIQQA